MAASAVAGQPAAVQSDALRTAGRLAQDPVTAASAQPARHAARTHRSPAAAGRRVRWSTLPAFGFAVLRGFLADRAAVLRSEVDAAIRAAYATTYDERVIDGISGHYLPAVLSTYLRSNLEFIRDHRKEIDAVTEIFLNVRSSDGSRRFAGGPGGTGDLKPLQEILQRGQDEGDFADFDTRTMA